MEPIEPLAKAVEDDFVAVWRSFRALPSAELDEDDRWLQLITGRPYALLNPVLRCALDEPQAPAVLDAALGRFADRGVPFVVWVLPSSRPSTLPQLLAERGLHEGEPWPGMAADLESFRPAEPGPAGLLIRPLTAAAEFPTFRAVSQAVFGQEQLWAALAELIEAQGTYAAGMHNFIGWLDGRAVATASFVLDGSVAGVYNIATLSDVRGRGIGTAMTEHVVRHAMDLGATLAVLQSSPAGEGIYRGLGFREVCRLRPFYGP